MNTITYLFKLILALMPNTHTKIFNCIYFAQVHLVK